jgi:hypothetical protein
MNMRLRLIACEVLYRELCWAVARSPNQVDVEFLPKALHDQGGNQQRQQLQERIDAVDPACCEAVCLGYGLCNLGTAGLVARHVPLVLPRAHDCITLLLGSRTEYQRWFDANPGTYLLSSGWMERGGGGLDTRRLAGPPGTGLDQTYEQLVAKYGSDNAAFLWESLNPHAKYSAIHFVSMGLEPDDRFVRRAEALAGERGWRFSASNGSMTLIARLVDGAWQDDFLVVQPGQRVVHRVDESVIGVEAAE